MASPTLIYCADGNARFAEIAINAGFKYGAQLPPRGLHFPPYFADQDWKNPNRERYMAELAKHHPVIASVLDWERAEQLPEVLAWAEEAAQFVQIVMVVPKVIGGIHKIPHRIGGKPIRLGYSVPTKFGGSPVPYSEFYGWPVHLLGGSPIRQRKLSKYLNVVSLDGNTAQKMAVKYNKFFEPGTAVYACDRFWPSLKEAGCFTATDAPYEAFGRSCLNIAAMWGVQLTNRSTGIANLGPNPSQLSQQKLF